MNNKISPMRLSAAGRNNQVREGRGENLISRRCLRQYIRRSADYILSFDQRRSGYR